MAAILVPRADKGVERRAGIVVRQTRAQPGGALRHLIPQFVDPPLRRVARVGRDGEQMLPDRGAIGRGRGIDDGDRLELRALFTAQVDSDVAHLAQPDDGQRRQTQQRDQQHGKTGDQFPWNAHVLHGGCSFLNQLRPPALVASLPPRH